MFSVFSVSLWLLECGIQQPQRHRGTQRLHREELKPGRLSGRLLSRHSSSAEVDSKPVMSRFFSNKVVRLVLSVSVSVWMAGACLFGCATGAMAAEPAQAKGVQDGASCHGRPSHRLKLIEGVAYIVAGPRGMMKDCPLGVNATAATSKSSTYSPEPVLGPVAALPSFNKNPHQPEHSRFVPFLHNRGSTHLQCCVFLI
jgi:hypothetical protein